MPFPSPPWRLHGQMWLSLFAVRRGGPTGRRPGVYGAAFVSYEEGSTLSYRELVVARVLDPARRKARVTDIWVDSAESLAAGRALWALPKQPAELELADRRLGPSARTDAAAYRDGNRIAAASFLGLPGAALVRTPFTGALAQRREDGTPVVTRAAGSGCGVPALARWDFAENGPLGFLHGNRPLLSFRLAGLRLTFGS